jgi:hypothetical protein
VAAYLHRIQRIENSLNAPLSLVTQTVSQFSIEQRAGATTLDRALFAAHARSLRGALPRIRSDCGRLAAASAPTAAARLRVLLIRLCSGEAHMTDQTAKLVAFLPAFATAQRALGPAALTLEHALAATKVAGAGGVSAAYAAKAAALRRFQATLARIVAKLEKLAVPEASRPEYVAQLRALQGMSSTAGQLASALVASPQGNVQALLAQFDRAATSNQSLAVQRAQIAAVRAYDARVAALTALSKRIALERLRIDSTLR